MFNFQLIIGNFALSRDQSRVQMAIWSVLAAPLIMSNDLRDIDPDLVDILVNPNVIEINQDPIGHQGKRIYKDEVGDVIKLDHCDCLCHCGSAGCTT